MINYKLYLIRHGFTAGNIDGRYIGATDLPLCKEGEIELIDLKKEKDYPDVGIIYTSPLKRCIQTAEILYPAVFTKKVSDIREFNFGEFENRKLEDLQNDARYLKWMKEPNISIPDGGESPVAFKQRIASGIQFILQDLMHEKIQSAAVITHGGVIMEILHSYGLPQRPPMEWSVKHGFGYTFITSSYLWSSGQKGEIYNKIPFSPEDENFSKDYDLFDISDEY